MKSKIPELTLVVANASKGVPQRPRRLNARRLISGIAVLLVAGLILSPYLSPPCGQPAGMSPMRCHWTFEVDWLLSLAAFFVAQSLWFVRHVEARRVVGGTLALFGVLVVAVSQSWVVGLCLHPEMACHRTAHWLWLWSGGLVGLGLYLVLAERVTSTASAAILDPWEASEKKPAGAA